MLKLATSLIITAVSGKVEFIPDAFACKYQCLDINKVVCKQVSQEGGEHGFCCDSIEECMAYFPDTYDCSYYQPQDDWSTY